MISREMIERIAEVQGGLEEETTYDGRKLRWTEEARSRMKRLDAITLDFARQVIEEETGAPLDIQAPSSASARARYGERQ